MFLSHIVCDPSVFTNWFACAVGKYITLSGQKRQPNVIHIFRRLLILTLQIQSRQKLQNLNVDYANCNSNCCILWPFFVSNCDVYIWWKLELVFLKVHNDINSIVTIFFLKRILKTWTRRHAPHLFNIGRLCRLCVDLDIFHPASSSSSQSKEWAKWKWGNGDFHFQAITW